jgi:transcription-repair coupling factor (superfamily II helicase)
VGYFIANPQSTFYETEIFMNLLNTIQSNPQGYRLVQQNEKLRLVIEPVIHIKDAMEKMSKLKV